MMQFSLHTPKEYLYLVESALKQDLLVGNFQRDRHPETMLNNSIHMDHKNSLEFVDCTELMQQSG
jgi:hypothetical protein